MTLEWAGPGETVTWVHGAVVEHAVVDPVAIPVETVLVRIEVSFTRENANAATMVARYRSWTSSTPLVIGLPDGCAAVVVVVVVAAAVVVVVVEVAGGAAMVAGAAATTGLVGEELAGMEKRGKVSVS